MRQHEPRWQEPLILPPAQRASGSRGPAIGLLAAGGFLLLLAAVSPAFLILAIVLGVIGGILLANGSSNSTIPTGVIKTRDDEWREYQQAHGAWIESIRREETAKKNKLSSAPRWYPILRFDTRRRIDVFGGSPEGWAALMHTAFAPSLDQNGPLTVLDLTRRDLARRALWPDLHPGQIGPLFVSMPSEMEKYDPLIGVQYPTDVVAALISSDGQQDDWARRDIETGILRRVAGVLNRQVTLPRMLAGVTSLLAPGSSLVSAQISTQELQDLLDPNFLVMLGGEAANHVGRVAAALESVTGASMFASGASKNPAEALPFLAPSNVVVSVDKASADPTSRRRIDNLLAASLVDRITHGGGRAGMLLVVGADRLSRANLEGLIAGADQAGSGLALFFEHLRGEAREILGRGGADSVMMRLGNHEDAAAAANFIGKQHRFVVSSITLTVGSQLGGSDSHGFSVSDANSYTRTAGPDSSTSGRTLGTNFSYSKTWSDTENYGETATRSEEFVARTEDIQRIPTTGFIYVAAVNGRQHVIFGDCHPAIARTPMMASRPITRR